jgi:transketolase N-terminal domain/subunit
MDIVPHALKSIFANIDLCKKVEAFGVKSFSIDGKM